MRPSSAGGAQRWRRSQDLRQAARMVSGRSRAGSWRNPAEGDIITGSRGGLDKMLVEQVEWAVVVEFSLSENRRS